MVSDWGTVEEIRAANVAGHPQRARCGSRGRGAAARSHQHHRRLRAPRRRPARRGSAPRTLRQLVRADQARGRDRAAPRGSARSARDRDPAPGDRLRPRIEGPRRRDRARDPRAADAARRTGAAPTRACSTSRTSSTPSLLAARAPARDRRDVRPQRRARRQLGPVHRRARGGAGRAAGLASASPTGSPSRSRSCSRAAIAWRAGRRDCGSHRCSRGRRCRCSDATRASAPRRRERCSAGSRGSDTRRACARRSRGFASSRQRRPGTRHAGGRGARRALDSRDADPCAHHRHGAGQAHVPVPELGSAPAARPVPARPVLRTAADPLLGGRARRPADAGRYRRDRGRARHPLRSLRGHRRGGAAGRAAGRRALRRRTSPRSC